MNEGAGSFLLPVLGVLFLAWFLFVALPSPAVTSRLLFFPDRSAVGPPPVLGGIRGREVEVQTADGLTVTGWWYAVERGASEDAEDVEDAEEAEDVDDADDIEAAGALPRLNGTLEATPPRAPAVVFLHGNAGHHGHRAFQAAGMLRHGVSVFLVGYRGYGGNPGRPSEEGVILDGQAVLAWVNREVGGGERVVVHGRSLGGAAAAQVIAREAPGSGPAGVILESTFISLEAMAGNVYPFLPRFLLRRLRGRLDSEGALVQASGLRARERALALHVIHGEADDLVPVAMGVALHALADELPGFEASPPLLVPGAGHNDLPARLGDAYFRQVADFVHRVTAESSGPPR